MTQIDSRSSTSLSSARNDLVNDVQRNARDMAQAAERVQRSYESESNRMAQREAPEQPERAERQRTDDRLDDRTYEESYNDDSVERAMVDAMQAKQAYTASLKALEVVNDVENAVLDILR